MQAFTEGLRKYQKDLKAIAEGNPHHAAWRKFLLDKSYEGRNWILADTFCNNQLLYWNVIAQETNQDDVALGLFVEVLRNRASNNIFMLCANYYSSGGYHDFKSFHSMPFSGITAGNEPVLQLDDSVFAGYRQRVVVEFSIGAELEAWRMRSLDIQASDLNKVMPDWNRRLTYGSEAHSQQEMQQKSIPCPKCLGRFGRAFFDIPKASQQMGLSGYALYAENTVAGWAACTNCGGQGATYEDWFRSEYPEKCIAESCTPGTGIVPYEPLPLIRKLDD